jgi:hypothetical protein
MSTGPPSAADLQVRSLPSLVLMSYYKCLLLLLLVRNASKALQIRSRHRILTGLPRQSRLGHSTQSRRPSSPPSVQLLQMVTELLPSPGHPPLAQSPSSPRSTRNPSSSTKSSLSVARGRDGSSVSATSSRAPRQNSRLRSKSHPSSRTVRPVSLSRATLRRTSMLLRRL